jgi:hypothetical protein
MFVCMGVWGCMYVFGVYSMYGTYVCGCVRVSVQVCVLGLIRVCVQEEKNIDLVLSFPLLSLDLAVLWTPLNLFLAVSLKLQSLTWQKSDTTKS